MHGSRARGGFLIGHEANKERTAGVAERHERAKVTKIVPIKAIWGTKK